MDLRLGHSQKLGGISHLAPFLYPIRCRFLMIIRSWMA